MKYGRDSSGYSLIEVVLAVVFIAAIGLAISHSFLKLTTSTIRAREGKKASALADMVMEQYVVYASSDFVHLDHYAMTDAKPMVVLQTPDNMGYDNFLITTTFTVVPSSLGLKQLDVFITGPGLPAASALHFTKFLSATNIGVNGANVDVYTTLIDGVTPLPGVEVHAPAYNGGGDIVGYTDANGYAYLENVKPSQGSLLATIKAFKPGSRSDIRAGGAGYQPGYYFHAGPGNDTVIYEKVVDVQPRRSNPVHFDQFEPAGRFFGVVKNSIDGTLLSNISVKVFANGTDGQYTLLNATWTVTTINGVFEVANIMPGNIGYVVQGIPGSPITIPPSDATNFIQGFAADPTNATWQAPIPYPITTVSGPTLKAQPEGPVQLIAQDNFGASMPNVTVTFTLPKDGFRSDTSTSVVIGAWGQVTLGNVVPADQVIPFYAYQMPPSSPMPPVSPNCGFYANASPNAAAGVTPTPATLTMTPAHTAYGVTVHMDDSAFGNVTVSGVAVDSMTPISTTSDASGAFNLCGLAPQGNLSFLTFSAPDPVTADFPANTLVVREIYAGQPVAGSTLAGALPGACPGSAGAVVSDGSGNFPAFCLSTTNRDSRTWTIDPLSSSWNWTNVRINPDIADLTLKATTPHMTDASLPLTITKLEFYSGPVLTLQPTLAEYPATGIVVDMGDGVTRLAGIHMYSGGGGATMTDVNGQYSIWSAVFDRAAGNLGIINVTADPSVATNNGQNYSGQTQTPAVNNPINFASPQVINFSLAAQGNGL